MKNQFTKQKYINLETFRKNSEGVKTPVWFALDGDTFHVWTQPTSGKAKRIRHNGSVKIVPSNGAGEPLGEWVDAHAEVDPSPEAMQHTIQLMTQKYGFSFRMAWLFGKLRKTSFTTLKFVLVSKDHQS